MDSRQESLLPTSQERIAIVHDWLLGMRGGERVLEILALIFPNADIFTLFYNPQKISPIINSHKVFASSYNFNFLQNKHRYLLPFYPLGAVDISMQLKKQHQIKPYRCVLSVSHAWAKNITVPEGVPHISYCLTPMRYIWDLFDEYFAHKSYAWVANFLRPYLQRWDLWGARQVDKFISISEYIKDRIERTYNRDSDVIYPPVPTVWLERRAEGEEGKGFLSVSALSPYKNVALVVEAFSQLGLPLTVVGSGPEEKNIKKKAAGNIRFLSSPTDTELKQLYKNSKALVFAAEEDFGMTPVESLASGRPVIAYGRGGALETVQAEVNGVFFEEQTVEAITKSVKYFLENEEKFTAENCLKRAERFNSQTFAEKIIGMVSNYLV